MLPQLISEIREDSYLKLIKANQKKAKEYYLKSLNKTEQQKALENLLIENKNIDMMAPYNIADLACGGGTLSYHLAKIFPNASFYLLDYNEEAIKLAQEINIENQNRFYYFVGDMRKIPLQNNFFDLIFCWQALSWFDFKDIWNIFDNIIQLIKENSGGGGGFMLQAYLILILILTFIVKL